MRMDGFIQFQNTESIDRFWVELQKMNRSIVERMKKSSLEPLIAFKGLSRAEFTDVLALARRLEGVLIADTQLTTSG